MLKTIQLQQLILASLAVVVSGQPTVKREISDTHLSSPYTSFPLGVTATLGSGAFSPLGYAGSLGNLYARSDDYDDFHDDGSHDFGSYSYAGHYYEYPQYALGYGGYEPNTVDDDFSLGSYYGGPALMGSGYRRYGARGLFDPPLAPLAYYNRLSGYYY